MKWCHIPSSWEPLYFLDLMVRYLCHWQEAELREAVAALQSTVSASKERLQRKATHLEERRGTAAGMVGADSVRTHILVCTCVYVVLEWKCRHYIYIKSVYIFFILSFNHSKRLQVFFPTQFCWYLLMHFMHTRLSRRHFWLQKRVFVFHANVLLLLDGLGMFAVLPSIVYH